MKGQTRKLVGLLVVVAGASAITVGMLRGGGAETPSGPAERAVRKPPSTTLQFGQRLTYLPGEVVPAETTLRCLSKGGQVSSAAVLPRPGEEGVAFVDPGPDLRVSVFADGTVKASCGHNGEL